VVIYALIFAQMSVHSSRVLHARMLSNIMRSPMMFFDTTPIGRILNRFSRDMDTVDVVLPFTIQACLSTFFNLLATIVVISYSTPIFLSVVVPLLIVYYLIQVSYYLIQVSLIYLTSVMSVTNPAHEIFCQFQTFYPFISSTLPQPYGIALLGFFTF